MHTRCPRYLESSAEIYDSLLMPSDLTQQVISARENSFTPLGSMYSTALQCGIPIGINKIGTNFIHRTQRELAIGACITISKKNDQRELWNYLPSFLMAILVDGRAIGVMTEDFSSNGKLTVAKEVVEITRLRKHINDRVLPTPLYTDIYVALDDHVFDSPASRMSSRIGGKNGIQRLIDFSDITPMHGYLMHPYYEATIENSALTVRSLRS